MAAHSHSTVRQLARYLDAKSLSKLYEKNEPLVFRDSLAGDIRKWCSSGEGTEELASWLQSEGTFPLTGGIFAGATPSEKMRLNPRPSAAACATLMSRLRAFGPFSNTVCIEPRIQNLDWLLLWLGCFGVFLWIFEKAIQYAPVLRSPTLLAYATCVDACFRITGCFLSLRQAVVACLRKNVQLYISMIAPKAIDSLIRQEGALPVLPDWHFVDAKVWVASERAESTPFHFDYRANLLVQLSGAKLVTFVKPEDTAVLRPMPGDRHMKEPYPSRLKSLPSDEGSARTIEVLIRPGDVLYIPPLWPHSTSNLEGANIGFNAFYDSNLTSLVGSTQACTLSLDLYSELCHKTFDGKVEILAHLGKELRIARIPQQVSIGASATVDELAGLLASETDWGRQFAFSKSCEENGVQFKDGRFSPSPRSGTLGRVPLQDLFFK